MLFYYAGDLSPTDSAGPSTASPVILGELPKINSDQDRLRKLLHSSHWAIKKKKTIVLHLQVNLTYRLLCRSLHKRCPHGLFIAGELAHQALSAYRMNSSDLVVSVSVHLCLCSVEKHKVYHLL